MPRSTQAKEYFILPHAEAELAKTSKILVNATAEPMHRLQKLYFILIHSGIT